ncbi:MAG: polysaccharide deacetylase family protein [Bacteroidales bacterium]|jgi:peptidoglycan/xylan/chitin deacetylase (PgdA/CDA1 family)
MMFIALGAILFIVLLLVFAASLKICWGIFMRSQCRIKTGSLEIALTFDDGPHPEHTPELLDLLKGKEIKATFFVIGENAGKYPEIIKRIVAEGHILGIHSFYHKPSFTILSRQAVIEDLIRCRKTIEEISRTKVTLFRPPYGVTNPNIAAAVKFLELKSVGWSIRSYDTTGRPEKSILKKVEKSLSPGAIILLHDRLPNCTSLVGKLLNLLDERGYKVVSL